MLIWEKSVTFAIKKILIMFRGVITAIILLLNSQLSAAENLDLDSLYSQLDETIEQLDTYISHKLEQIDRMKVQYSEARQPDGKYECAKILFNEYRQVMNDSALKYGKICLTIAGEMGRDDLKTESYIRLAHQYAECGVYTESINYFNMVQPEYLDGQRRVDYYSGLSHLYGEMGAYSIDKELRSHYFHLSDIYGDSLISVADSTSVIWLSQKVKSYFDSGNYEKAKQYCDIWQTKVKPETSQFAYMAFYRSEIYNRLGDKKMQKYWLAKSAISDLKCAIMNQASLWSLAKKLSEDGDIARSYRFVECSWKCSTMVKAHLRSWQILPVLTVINDNYKNQLKRTNHMLWVLIGSISLLAFVLLVMYIYVGRKRKQLSIARNELKNVNGELESLNGQLSEKNSKLSETNLLLSDANHLLQDTNEKLRQAVIHLNDSNRVKDEYIGKFLSICSEYIDKLDNYRIKVNRKLKANQYNDLLRMTSSGQLKENELKELFDNFDSVFLQLFPTFVDDFNALLRPEERIYPTGKSSLNTYLRIFALIRLGIDKSSKIAEFLHYSPNSIYVYRANTKNKAANTRDDFERLVKEIGMQG